MIVPPFGGENSFTSWRIVRIESKQNLLTHHASGGQGYPYILCCSWKRFIPISFWYTFSGTWRTSVFFSWLSECLWKDFYNPTCPYFWWIKLIYSQNVFIEFLLFVKKNYFSSRVYCCLVFLMHFKKATEEFVEWEVIVLNTTWEMATEKHWSHLMLWTPSVEIVGNSLGNVGLGARIEDITSDKDQF